MVIVQTTEECRFIRSGAGNADTRATRILGLAAPASSADDAIEKRLRDIPYYGGRTPRFGWT